MEATDEEGFRWKISVPAVDPPSVTPSPCSARLSASMTSVGSSAAGNDDEFFSFDDDENDDDPLPPLLTHHVVDVSMGEEGDVSSADVDASSTGNSVFVDDDIR